MLLIGYRQPTQTSHQPIHLIEPCAEERQLCVSEWKTSESLAGNWCGMREDLIFMWSNKYCITQNGVFIFSVSYIWMCAVRSNFHNILWKCVFPCLLLQKCLCVLHYYNIFCCLVLYSYSDSPISFAFISSFIQ